MLRDWAPNAFWDTLRIHALRFARFVVALLMAALKAGYQHPALVGVAALLLRLWSRSKHIDPALGAAACAGHSPGLPDEARADRSSHCTPMKSVSLRIASDNVSENSSVETHIIYSDEEDDEESNATSLASWATSRASQKRNRRTRPTHQYAESYTKSWAVDAENRRLLQEFKMRAAHKWNNNLRDEQFRTVSIDEDLEFLAPSASCSRRTSPEKQGNSRAKPSVICIQAGPDSDALVKALKDYSLTRERVAKVGSVAPVRRSRTTRRRHGRVAT
jgi:hypothetical protein